MTTFANLPNLVRSALASTAGSNRNAVALRSLNRNTRARPGFHAFSDRVAKLLQYLRLLRDARVQFQVVTKTDEAYVVKFHTIKYFTLQGASGSMLVTSNQAISFFNKLADRVTHIDAFGAVLYDAPHFELMGAELIV